MQALLTEAPPANGAVVAATTQGSGISSQLVIPRPKRSLFEVPATCMPATRLLPVAPIVVRSGYRAARKTYEHSHPARVDLQVPRFDAEEMMLYLAHQARTGSLPDAAAPGMEGHQVHCLLHRSCCEMLLWHPDLSCNGHVHDTVSTLVPTACCMAQDLMYHLTSGNAREMRKFGTGLLY